MRVSETVKTVDSVRNVEEHMKNKPGKGRSMFTPKTRDSLAKILTIKVNIVAGMNVHGERIKMMEKRNEHADFRCANQKRNGSMQQLTTKKQ